MAIPGRKQSHFPPYFALLYLLMNNIYRLGPEGIIRKLSTETDAIPELKPADRKRKADSDRQGHASEPGRERTKRRYTKRGTGGRKKLV